MRIQQLSDEVINKIAAGEILHRPVNAVKELIENSLDAGSNAISVSVADGGLKLIQIQDSGSGIHKDDLSIVCNRFTTSKLSTVEDLYRGLSTFGFRGEALASISYVSNLTIITKTPDSSCAYKVQYRDGNPINDPKPCAGNNGTTIIIEDLFYNMPTRKKLLTNANEEYQKIVECMLRYAIDRYSVSFNCRKIGSSLQDVSTKASKDPMQSITQLFPSTLYKELCTLSIDSSFKAELIYSNANFNQKRFVFIPFINGRLIECTRLKQAISNLFARYLPKTTFPWVYISLQIPPHKVDVNVHPTKKEVQFLDEDLLIETVVTKLQDALAISQSSRIFVAPSISFSQITNNKPSVPESQKIRNDPKLRKLDEMLCSKIIDVDSGREKSDEVDLTSVLELRHEVLSVHDPDISRLFHDHVYVGVADKNRLLLQHRSALLMIDLQLSEMVFYQKALQRFGKFASVKFQPLDIETLLRLADSRISEQDVKHMAGVIIEHSEMIDEYFGIVVNEGYLVGIPCVCDDYYPQAHKLPGFVYNLATKIEWTDEKHCFKDICQAIARLYVPEFSEEADLEAHAKAILRAFSGAKFQRDARKYIHELAELNQLYRIFERC